VADALDAAAEADLVRPAGTGCLAFAHALVRETLLAETPELRRARLHARVAAALPESTDPFARAHHLVSGRPFTDARATVTACATAAERAAADHAHESAARWWERALAALDADPAGEPPALRQELLLRAGTTMARAGSWASASQLLGAVIDAALDRNDTDTAAFAADQLWGIGGLWFPVTYNTYPAHLVERLEFLLAAIGDVDGPARVRTLAALATVCHYGPDRGRGVRESARALAVARRTGRPDLLATALTAELAASWLPGRERELIAAATELLALPTEHPELEVLALARRGVSRLALGDVEGHADDLAEGWERAERHELPLIRAQLVAMQAARTMLSGSFEVAMELVDRAAALTQQTQLYTRSWQDLVMRAFIWIDQGCLPERLAEMPTDVAGPDGGSGDVLVTALSLLQSGRPADAAAVMAGQGGFEPLPMQWDWLSLTCWQAVIATELASAGADVDRSLLERLAGDLLPFARQIAIQGGIGALGPVGLYLGRVEAAAGRTEDAETHLREAIALAERHGFRPPLARARLALAELLAGRGAPAESAAEAAEARAVADEVGMRLIVEQASRLAHE
jgi:tetratricopeptide (TPR) repeat protein